MTEKIVFEFRADHKQSGCGSGFGHSICDLFGPSILDCHDMMSVHGMSCGGRSKQSYHEDRARHHMRDTLDLFERLYKDLFGEEAGRGKEQESD